jgi:hypothetical protein
MVAGGHGDYRERAGHRRQSSRLAEERYFSPPGHYPALGSPQEQRHSVLGARIGIEMTNVEVSYFKDDLRPALVREDVQGAEFNLAKARRATGVPTFRLKNVEDFGLFHCGNLPDVQLAKASQKES